MRPIPATIEAVESLGHAVAEGDLLQALQAMADEVQELVPDCLGLSLTWTEFGVTFTLAATDAEIAVLDAVQYLAGGPCEHSIQVEHGVLAGPEQLFDEREWQLFGLAGAARGVRSTITFPLAHHGDVVGSANLYGGSDRAFDDHEESLAEILGGWAPGLVRNADLSFSTRSVAEQAPQRLESDRATETAVGYIAESKGLDLDSAREELSEAARRAGISAHQLAEAIIRLRP